MPMYTIQMTSPPYPEKGRVLLVSPCIKNVDDLSPDLIWKTDLTAKNKREIMERAKIFQAEVRWNV